MKAGAAGTLRLVRKRFRMRLDNRFGLSLEAELAYKLIACESVMSRHAVIGVPSGRRRLTTQLDRCAPVSLSGLCAQPRGCAPRTRTAGGIEYMSCVELATVLASPSLSVSVIPTKHTRTWTA